MKSRNLIFTLSFFVGFAIMPSQALADKTIYVLNQIDPSPYASYRSFTGLSNADCLLLCQTDGQCQAYYWVPQNGSCWLKGTISSPTRKLYEQGVGGIKIEG
ncbi:MAG: PAN domain-containing protein [Nostoc sp.]|uniref:PAN domain-containing protein n=1 Tax=Nostoc sp. TaxID=1180 RepID=UPI002FFABABB